MKIFNWIQSICFITIAISSLIFVYCQWQNVKAQREQAIAITGFYNNSTRIFLEAMLKEQGIGESLYIMHDQSAHELLKNIQK